MGKTAAIEKPPSHKSARPSPAQGIVSHRPDGANENTFLGLQRTVGNQAVLQGFESGVIQTKLRVSQPGDPDEAEADRAADHVVAATHAPKIQRKCACSGTGSPCAKCEEEESGTIHRSVASPMLRSSQLSLQRAPAGPAPANTPDQAGNPPKPSPTPSHAHPLVVEDDAKSVAPHQMRKSAFIALLRADACATADAVLTSVGRTTKSCPYIEKWLAFYEKQSSDHIERAILKYAPETATARSAHEAIRLVVMRVQRAAMTWAKTGKVTDLPADLASQLPGQGFLGAVQSFASSSVGGAILGFLGGSKPEKSAADVPAEKSPAPTVSRKASGVGAGAAPAHDAGAVRSQLGAGHSLDSHVQSQMSTAFGHDFSGVRVHTDSRATALSSNLNARAFTLGSDVAFASGEYKPGTPVGDALIAHELAHVVQQSAAAQSSPMSKATDHSASTTEPGGSQLENDADLSAVGAVASIWAGAKRGLADVGQNAIPRLRSGLRLQRCNDASKPKAEPEISCTAQALGKNVSDCMKRVNKQTYDCNAGVHYATNYQTECPGQWNSDYNYGYADPNYFERLSGSAWNWRLKPRKSASEAIKKWLTGLTIAECLSTTVACEIDAVRAAIGDAKFDSLYGSAEKDIPEARRLHVGTDLSLTPVGAASTPTGAAAAGPGTPDNRPAKIGEWYYFKNHPKYLKKHPRGAWQGENSVYLGRSPLGRQLWIGLGTSSGPPLNQPEVTEEQMLTELLEAYNAAPWGPDLPRLEQIRVSNGGVLPPEYQPKTAANPSGYPSTITKQELLDAGGGFQASSGQTLDVPSVQHLKDQ